MCQLVEINYFVESNTWLDGIWQLKRRIPRFIKNRWYFIRYQIVSLFKKQEGAVHPPAAIHLKPGHLVKIKSKEDILATLNGWKCFEGCRFMDEMWDFCGKRYKVLKVVHRLLDEREMRMKKVKNVVILDGLMCNGSWPFQECDRSCFYLWKEAWLAKVS